MNGVEAISIRGEELLLHPDRAVIWPRRGSVIVADTHFGKSSVFNRHGIAVAAGTDELDRTRLTRLLTSSASRRLIVLGDFLHEPLDPTCQDAHDMETWIRSLAGVSVQVIAGNHDRGVSRGWRGTIEWIAGDYYDAPFRFVHDSALGPLEDVDVFSLSGHLHPVVRLKSLRKRTARVPAFWLRQSNLVLPSFGSFTGGYAIDPRHGERVFAVSPDRVVAFPIRNASGRTGYIVSKPT